MAALKETHRQIATGTFWGLAGNIVLKLVSFVYLVLVAQVFAQDTVGTFYLALSIVGIITVFSDMGISSAFSRYIPYYLGNGQKEKAYHLLYMAYIFSGGLSVLAAIAVLLLSAQAGGIFHSPFLPLPLAILSAYLVLLTLYSLNNAFFTGLKKVKYSNALNAGQNILKLILTGAFFWWRGPTLQSLAIGFVLSFLIVTALSFLYLRREIRGLALQDFSAPPWKEQIALLREVVPFGLTLSIVVALWALVSYTDEIVIGYYLPQATAAVSVAIYTVAIALAGVLLIFPGSVASILFPILSELHGRGETTEMGHVARVSFRWILMLTVPLTLVLVAFPDTTLQLFYGKAYAKGATVLVIFSIGLFIRSLSYVQSYVLAALQKVQVELVVACAAALLNVILNLALTPVYGMEGAAVASLVAFLAATLLLTHYSHKIFGFGFPPDSYKPLLAGAVALGILLVVRDPVNGLLQGTAIGTGMDGWTGLLTQKAAKLLLLAMLFALVTAIYFLVLVGLRAFGSEDIALHGKILRRVGTPEPLVATMQRFMGGGMGE